MEAFKADKLRGYISKKARIDYIIDFRNELIFENAGIATCIISLSKGKQRGTVEYFKFVGPGLKRHNVKEQLSNQKLFEPMTKAQSSLGESTWSFGSESTEKILSKIDSATTPLGSILHIGQGMQTGENSVFGKRTLAEIRSWGLKSSQHYRRATNSDINKYHVFKSGEFLVYLEDFDKFSDLPKGLQQYLRENGESLRGRAAFKRGNCEWWKYTWPLHKEFYTRKKILCPYLAPMNRFAIDSACEFIGLTDTVVLFDNKQEEDLRYLVALLNSDLLTFRFWSIGKLKGNGIFEYFWNSISKIPIKRIDFSIAEQKRIHDELCSLVDQITESIDRQSQTQNSHEKTLLSRESHALDKRINAIVYEIYGLNKAEIQTVQNAIGGQPSKDL
jgi:hypothetical protein